MATFFSLLLGLIAIGASFGVVLLVPSLYAWATNRKYPAQPLSDSDAAKSKVMFPAAVIVYIICIWSSISLNWLVGLPVLACSVVLASLLHSTEKRKSGSITS